MNVRTIIAWATAAAISVVIVLVTLTIAANFVTPSPTVDHRDAEQQKEEPIDPERIAVLAGQALIEELRKAVDDDWMPLNSVLAEELKPSNGLSRWAIVYRLTCYEGKTWDDAAIHAFAIIAVYDHKTDRCVLEKWRRIGTDNPQNAAPQEE